VLGFVKNPRLMTLVERIARRHIRRQVPDPTLRELVTPDYTIGCKRILPTNKWYPALGQPNVEVTTSGIKEIRASSVVTDDGVEHPVDTIIFGTGFSVTDVPAGRQLRGRGGQLLEDAWNGSMRAYLGTAIPGFPNLFMMLGPNTGLGHSSMVYMAESQVAYIMDALKVMRERGVETVELRPTVESSFNAAVEEKMQGTVWNTGCASWYLDDTGRNGTLWPDWTWRFRQRTARFDPAQYELGRAASRPVSAGAPVAV
jgi:cation diffusion facilitator CzcD-associated flavoprotein CzcO